MIPKDFIIVVVMTLSLILTLSSVYLRISGSLWIFLPVAIIGIVLISFLIWIFKKRVKKVRTTLRLSKSELKNYEFFDILTNKRYIRRNYYLNFEEDYSAYSEEVYDLVEDVFFLNLKCVSRVIFLNKKKIIALEIKGFENIQGFPIKFFSGKISEFLQVRSDLIDLLDLEFNDGKMGYEEIYHTKLFDMSDHPFEEGDGAKVPKLEMRIMVGVAILCLIGGLFLIVLGITQLSFDGLGSWVIFVIIVPLGALVLIIGFFIFIKLRKEISENQ